MDFIDLTEKSQLNPIIEESESNPRGVLIFKHSTRCAISKMALNRFKREWGVPEADMSVYYLDLIRYRSLSDEVSERFSVQHESPQVLLIKNGKCIYHASHNGISPQLIEQESFHA